MKKKEKIPNQEDLIKSISILLSKTIEQLDSLIDHSNKDLPDGLDIIVLTPDVMPNGVFSKQGKHLSIGFLMNGSTLPQEYQEAIRQEVLNLRAVQQDNPDSQTPQSHPNHQNGYFSRGGRSCG